MRISDWSSDVCSSDLQLARSRLGIQSLHVPLFGDLQRRVGEHLQEFALVEHATRHPPLRPERGDEADKDDRSEEHTSELQSLMRTSYAVFCLKKKKTTQTHTKQNYIYTSRITSQQNTH